MSFALGIRGRFLAVVFGGVLIPIALAGVWLARRTRQSGETLLRARAEQSLADVARAIGYRWVDQRSALLGLSDNPAVVEALERGHELRQTKSAADIAELDRAWRALDGVVDRLSIRDTSGTIRGILTRPAPAPGIFPAIAVRIPIYAPQTAVSLGWLDAKLRLAAVLPTGFWLGGVSGSVAAVFEPESNASLVPLPMPAGLLERTDFQWSGEHWLVVRRAVDEPRMELALAAPTGAVVEPFAAAAREGSIALGMAVIVALVLATLLTRRVTQPLLGLAEHAEAVGDGELGQTVPIVGPSEIRRVATAFNGMTAKLRDTLARLSHQEGLAAVGEFAASLAHEVRNPLTAVRLDLERARERIGDAARADALMEQALRQIDRLDGVVSGSLRIARSGRLELQPVDVMQPLQAAVRSAQPMFVRKDARLRCAASGVSNHTPPSDLPIEINGNAGALEQLFLNLLINAADALSPGRCADIQVERVPGEISIRVCDEGSGILTDQLARVMQPFYTTKENGTGLGLALSRRIAEAHGGRLSIDSTVGVGTTVEVRLPEHKSIRHRNGS